MRLARSFFFAFFCALLLGVSAVPALAGDGDPAPPQPLLSSGKQAVLTRGPYARQFLARAGLLLEETRVELGRPLAAGSTRWAPGTAALNDGVCYTMRVYRVTPSEHVAEGETGRRGYASCESAADYQVRTAAELPGVEKLVRK